MVSKTAISRLSVFAAAVFFFATVANAGSYNLGELIATNGKIEIGDKIFADFGFTGSDVLSANDITVEATVDSNGVYYLTFQGAFTALPGERNDWGLYYSAESTGAGISMIDQGYNLTGGAGYLSVGETVWDEGFFQGDRVAQSTVAFGGTIDDPIDPPGEIVQGDDLIINPVLNKVWVTKDIFVTSTGETPVGATIISQSFHQPVPEPGTLMLLGSGLIGMRMLFRKKVK